ncbi:hypothetical protein GOARA_050_00710 [Gordonia araii NBRC 100433]|uniref:Uncharacterized protein n=1 Tax=Gordonia araii NBRC 100433 TaxID=1073574 RepID=G7H2D3_9ACTN|nr:hypothetical protein [Gordonia araii]NNG97547.1 hypothetical protein [Gordonia araii NBRC 100433]GAB10008.1 hypothetical protein GOARA_050_00710 [Gordonia araii NBRC 100433]
MLPSEIRRWKVEDIESVFGLCDRTTRTCEWIGQPIANPDVFSTWSGDAARAARRAGKKRRKDLDAHGNEARRVGVLAKRAATAVGDLQVRLDKLAKAISDQGMVLHENTGYVEDLRPPSLDEQLGSTDVAAAAAAAEREAMKQRFQQQVADLMRDADDADRDLAVAVQAASGETPMNQIGAPGDPNCEGSFPGKSAREVWGSTPFAQNPNSQIVKRYIPMVLPKGWRDNPRNPTTNLGKTHSKKVVFDPNDRGVTGPYSGSFHRRGSTSGSDKIEFERHSYKGGKFTKTESLEIDVDRGTRLRADSATPTSMREVTINGKQYMEVEYTYDYSASNTVKVGVNGIPFHHTSGWNSLTVDEVNNLYTNYGIAAPRPGVRPGE